MSKSRKASRPSGKRAATAADAAAGRGRRSAARRSGRATAAVDWLRTEVGPTANRFGVWAVTFAADYWPMIEPRWKFVQRWAATLTPVGRSVGIIGLVAWLIAIVAGWTELALLASAVLMLLLIAALFMLGKTDVAVRVTVEPIRVTVGEPVAGEVVVRNKAWTPMLPIRCEVPVGAGGVAFMLPLLAPGSEHTEIFVVPTEKRGVIDVGPVVTARGDALGLFRRDVSWSNPTEIFVHPVITPLESLGSGLIQDLEGRSSETISVSDLAFHALREYTPGDDLRHIHWKSTARHGKMLVRQFLDTRRAHLTIVLDGRLDSYRDEEDYELGISVAGSLLTRAILDGYDTTLLSGHHRMTGGNSRAALDICSRLEPDSRRLSDTARDAARVAPDTSLAVFITGAQADFTMMQRSAIAFPSEASHVAFVIDREGKAGLRSTAYFPLLTLTQLSELPALIKWGI